MNYPINHLVAKNTFRIAHISDLHLGEDIYSIYHQNFLTILKKICTLQADLLVLTGDLVNDGKKQGYDWLFSQLNQSKIPFLCTAGNHDVTIEKNTHLSFEKREFLPIKPDKRLLNQHITTIDLDERQWQILLLDSTKAGEIYGEFSHKTLNWLDDALTKKSVPSLIFFHHHPLIIHSAWMDQYLLKNAQAFWQIIKNHPHVQAIFCGHVHQAQKIKAPTNHLCQLYTTPATSRQFLPFEDSFCLDKKPAGFRMITLKNTKIQTQVYRI